MTDPQATPIKERHEAMAREIERITRERDDALASVTRLRLVGLAAVNYVGLLRGQLQGSARAEVDELMVHWRRELEK